MIKTRASDKAVSYADYKRSHNWIENSLAHSDEEEGSNFDWKLVRMFFPYIGKYKTPAIWSMVLMLVYTILNLLNPWLIGLAIDNYIIHSDLVGLGILSVIFLVVNIAMWQAQYWQVWSMSWAGQQILFLLSADMFTHLQRLSLSFYDHTQIGRVMSRLQSDIDVLEAMLSSGLLSMLGSVIALVGIIILMLVMSPLLALLTFVVLPIMFIIAAFWQKHAQMSFRRTRASISLVNSTLQENISGMRVIQSLVREDRNRAEFDDLNAYNRDTNLESSRIAALVLPLVEVVAALAICLAVIYGGYLVSKGQLLIGTLVAFVLYINRFFDPIRDLSQQYTQLQRAGVAAERIFQILNMKVEIKDKPDAQDLPEIKGDVRFKDVVFGYNPAHPVLRGLNWDIKAGQTVAIVGPTGAGKSTIISLLTRFYDIQSGSITIDGYDLRDVTQKSLRRQVGVVPQEPFLFTGSIADNIRYGRLEATDEEVMEAAKIVGAHDLIIQLPDGYNTPIRERGRNLSMGQRQLISFARALLADPHILILDEATANIDTFTEAIVQMGLKKLLHGRTAFVIAHRLSTIKDADSIVVLQAGQIVEQGTHSELLQREGEYASLYAMGFRHTAAAASA
ncbi:ABC transporter ATP-binding protein [Dictyobacter aurantiacus]|uniref:Multidrug ABC transporter n=1 Tax=Dictyobacter aurantiacus TaxID=1936993 RepID=A0A401ZS21_9CHLR|nr:ABC transporter ATP-binding protein [Dictyobacter aurantiacus]GCE09602.1 multidrug ABC transporter [Dictyobacter aurantiacus]